MRRQCSTSVDDVSTAPLCGRDAATRGAEFEAGRHGGAAEFESGSAEHTIVHDLEASPTSSGYVPLRLGTVIKSRRAISVAGRGPVSGHQVMSQHTECGETRRCALAHHLSKTFTIGL